MVELDTRRAVDVERPASRIPERVLGQNVGLDRELIEHSSERARPGRACGAFDFSQRHPPTVGKCGEACRLAPNPPGV